MPGIATVTWKVFVVPAGMINACVQVRASPETVGGLLTTLPSKRAESDT